MSKKLLIALLLVLLIVSIAVWGIFSTPPPSRDQPPTRLQQGGNWSGDRFQPPDDDG
jgi:hypothetical protein